MPPGNNKDNDTWTPKRAQKGEIKLTPGKGLQDLNCSVTDLVEQVVKGNKVGRSFPISLPLLGPTLPACCRILLVDCLVS